LAAAQRPSADINGRWSHLFADTTTELHEFAASIGLRRAWFRDKEHPRVAVRILRHSKIAVTMEIYTEVPMTQPATRCAASVTSSTASCCTVLLHEDQRGRLQDRIRPLTWVGRTHHDANHDLVVAGNPIPVGPRRSRITKAAGTTSGSCAVALEALGDPDLDDGLPGNAEAPRFPVQGLDHP
jgi:hypothetical protein